MSRYKKIAFFFLSLFLLFLFAGKMLYHFGNQNPQRTFSAEKLESRIHKDRDEMKALLESFDLSAYTSHEELWAGLDSFESGDYSILIFQGFDLVAWNNQLLPVEGINPQYFRHSLVRLDNGWYLTVSIQSNDVLMVAFSLLKSEYHYQNAFLQDGFPAKYGLDASVSIYRQQRPGDIPVFDEKGNFLFGLAPNTTISQNSNTLSLSTVMWLLALICLWLCLFFGLLSLKRSRWINLFLLLAAGFFIWLFYYFMWERSLLVNVYPDLFSPVYFAASLFLPSLGHLVLYVLLLVTISFWFFKFYKFPDGFYSPHFNRFRRVAALFFFLIILLLILIYINKLFYLLVTHSSGTVVVTKVIDINWVVLVRMFVFGGLLLSFELIYERVVVLFLPLLSRKQLLFMIVLMAAIFGVIFKGPGVGESDWVFVLFVLLGIILVYARRRTNYSHLSTSYLWIAGLFAIYTGATLLDQSIRKEESNRELLIENLAFQLQRDEDPVAEVYLAEIEKQLANDVTLIRMLAQPNLDTDAIRNHLVKFYFYGYWGRYDLQVIPCWPQGDVYLQETDEVKNCYSYFYQMVESLGYKIAGSKHFHYLNNNNGSVSFFGIFRFFPDDPLKETSLFIELHSKPFFEGAGYPELLVNSREQARMKLFEDYSYAKYVNGKLVKRSGAYNYKSDLNLYSKAIQGKVFVQEHGYSHLVYKPTDNFAVVLSRKDYSVGDVFMAFSIFFIFFFVLGGIGLFFGQWRRKGFSLKVSIQKRIQLAFVFLMLLMLVVVAAGTVFYTVHQFERKHLELLENKIQSVLLELEYKVGFDGPETYLPEEYFNYQLQMLSNVFNCDINLFGIDGKLVGTSRPEIYRHGLSGIQMNPSAYYQLAYTEAEHYLDKERIGGMDYLSFYVPFLNSENRLAGFVNLPYFVGNNELEDEISSVIVTIINFYLVFSFLVIGFAVFLARQITRPLLMLQNKISKVKLGHLNEKIDYRKEDEIGELVTEYNRMVDELAVSAEKLAKGERELAWREMAKQIAHEIKNPLTPMKLNIQYLQRAWSDQTTDFGDYLKRVTNSLIEQINSLSTIASEFSQFAQMPSAKAEEVNVVEKIKNTIDLYAGTEGVELSFTRHSPSTVMVKADGEQLLRVFNNLIKNAIQAARPGSAIKVDVEVQLVSDKVCVIVRDNGRGVAEEIRDKLFVPSFTTKSGGMGLGLAIVRRIVENAGGDIRYEPNSDGGAVFTVELPVVNYSSDSDE